MAKKKPKPSYQERLVAAAAMHQKMKDDQEAKRAARRNEHEKHAEFRAKWVPYRAAYDKFVDNMYNGILPVYEELTGFDKEAVDDYLRMKDTSWADLQSTVAETMKQRQIRAEEKQRQAESDTRQMGRSRRTGIVAAAIMAGIGVSTFR